MNVPTAAKRLSFLALLAGLATLFALPTLGPGGDADTANAQVAGSIWGRARTLSGTYETNYTAAGTLETITNPNTTLLPDPVNGNAPISFADVATQKLKLSGTSTTTCNGSLGTQAGIASCTTVVQNFRLWINDFRAIDIERLEVQSGTLGLAGSDHSLQPYVKVEGVCVRQVQDVGACLSPNADGSYSFSKESVITGTVKFPAPTTFYSMNGTGGKGQTVVGVRIKVNLEPSGGSGASGEANIDLGIAESFVSFLIPPTPTPTATPTATSTPSPVPTPTPMPGVNQPVVVPMLSRDGQ